MKYLLSIAISIALTAVAAAQSGTWSKKTYSVDGSWEIATRGSQKVLVLKNLKTKNAPDLKIFFSKKSLGSVNGKNATQQAILLAPLKSNKGNQEYIIPASLKTSEYETLLIHCEKFSKLWAGASL